MMKQETSLVPVRTYEASLVPIGKYETSLDPNLEV